MARVVYLGHSYHAQTRSTAFLIDLLAAHFDLTTIWDESWQPGKPEVGAAEINGYDPDCLVLFQHLPSRGNLRKIRCPNITWIPMYDNVAGAPRDWRSFRRFPLKVLNFSRSTHALFSGLGFVSAHFQYFPPPARRRIDPRPPAEGPRIFFWQRVEEVDVSTVIGLLGDARPRRWLLRHFPDPGQQPERPSERERCEYRIETIEGWLGRDAYLDLLSECDLFVAPRRREGIGQAALDAMAQGLAVVAADEPTMNEYIRDGVNGYLYDPANPAPLDLGALDRVRRQSLEDLTSGFARWNESIDALLAFIRFPESRWTRWRARARGLGSRWRDQPE